MRLEKHRCSRSDSGNAVSQSISRPREGQPGLWTFLSRRSPMPPTNPRRRANPRGGQPHFELQSISAMTQQADTGRETENKLLRSTTTIYLYTHHQVAE
ncbi:uncharacterized protein AKAW2_70322A [Aspergillus luchuensis]|uniref:Uncharacterized protein n=1 Tax=Aspergillus kawachii TaxID=1069201 RepID=A0A7R8A259_ASPKA|nr:uncharacterized protein AKAW2_70322A [Aspergillus luchuensis]BCS03444.1 hypothetical protein AKAW2_70322A [Aspergillus luchuensis]